MRVGNENHSVAGIGLEQQVKFGATGRNPVHHKKTTFLYIAGIYTEPGFEALKIDPQQSLDIILDIRHKEISAKHSIFEDHSVRFPWV